MKNRTVFSGVLKLKQDVYEYFTYDQKECSSSSITELLRYIHFNNLDSQIKLKIWINNVKVVEVEGELDKGIGEYGTMDWMIVDDNDVWNLDEWLFNHADENVLIEIKHNVELGELEMELLNYGLTE